VAPLQETMRANDAPAPGGQENWPMIDPIPDPADANISPDSTDHSAIQKATKRCFRSRKLRGHIIRKFFWMLSCVSVEKQERKHLNILCDQPLNF